MIGLIGAVSLLVVACSSAGSDTGDTGTPEATLSPAESRGQSLFRGEGCSACHRTNSRGLVGPGLGGISSRGDDDYIRQSIKDPGAVVVDGFNNVMSDFSGLSDEKVDDLIAYLRTLD